MIREGIQKLIEGSSLTLMNQEKLCEKSCLASNKRANSRFPNSPAHER